MANNNFHWDKIHRFMTSVVRVARNGYKLDKDPWRHTLWHCMHLFRGIGTRTLEGKNINFDWLEKSWTGVQRDCGGNNEMKKEKKSMTEIRGLRNRQVLLGYVNLYPSGWSLCLLGRHSTALFLDFVFKNNYHNSIGSLRSMITISKQH